VTSENLVGYLDGELAPEDQAEVERALMLDPEALALFRRLCRQRLMLAESLKAASAQPRRAFRFRWQVAAAMILFAATITGIWFRNDPGPRVATLSIDGKTVRTLTEQASIEIPAASTGRVDYPGGARVLLQPSTRARLHPAPVLDLRRGSATFRAPGGTGEARVDTDKGTMIVRGSEFSVELVRGPEEGGQSMESLLALVVSVLMGNVQVDAAGKTHVLAAGESRVFGADGAVANNLADFLALQDEKKEKDEKKEGEDKEKKGKKKEKKEGEKKEKKGKEKEGDDDDKDEKKGKDKEKGKKDND
jgi:anti-sigma factor RsiW